MSTKVLLCVVAITLLVSASAFAVDGVVLINQAGVMAAGGFPFVISHQGSYRLTSNLIVPAGLDGIDITADGVTIDLNGFSIIGPLTCTGTPHFDFNCSPAVSTGAGIHSSGDNTTIRNGTVQGMGEVGVELTGTGTLVEEVHVKFNKDGMFAFFSIVRRCTASMNLSNGIVVLMGVAESNFSTSNGGPDIDANSATVIGNTLDNLRADGSLYGSNQILGGVSASFPALSQFNNNCSGKPC